MPTVFFSYSHKDETLRDELEAHLGLLRNQGLIEHWHDRRILAGEELDPAILHKLERADVILLLISSDFISSWYCYSREMGRAMERHHAGEARVIPVILRHCDWKSAPFGKLMAAPRDGRAVASWPDRDEAFTDVALQIRRAIEGLKPARQPHGSSSEARPADWQSPLLPGSPGPRSSNLRLKQEFSDHDRAAFLRSTFDFVCNYFENSVREVGTRNPNVQGTYERIDSRRMHAVLYRNGKTIAECSVRLGGLVKSNGMVISLGQMHTENSFNEMLNVEDGPHSLHMRSSGMAARTGSHDNLSQEGAAELLWGLFVERAQY